MRNTNIIYIYIYIDCINLSRCTIFSLKVPYTWQPRHLKERIAAYRKKLLYESLAVNKIAVVNCARG